MLRWRGRVNLTRCGIYVATVGGAGRTEPAVDLAVALALAGARSKLSLPVDLVAFGEVGLAGEIRSVAGIGRRLTEASRMGFRRAIVPVGTDAIPADCPIQVRQVADVASAISAGLACEPDDRGR